MSLNQETSTDPVALATRSALGLLLLTSVHHAYGAYVYNTPWRYRVLPVSGITALTIWRAAAVMRSHSSPRTARIARGLFVVATLGFTVILIGGVEGAYNHLVKNLLYFGGAPDAVIQRLFPPPTYEMPNDAFFEITGISQAFVGGLTAWHLWKARRLLVIGHKRQLSGE
jgi:hypothetical protein